MKYESLNNVPTTGVSHNLEINKKVLIRNGDIPHLTQLARITFTPGQIATAHKHLDMYEVFNAESGNGEIRVDGDTHRLTTGDCITVEPGEEHEVINTGSDNLILTVLGIVV